MDEEGGIPSANNRSRNEASVEQSDGGIRMSAGSSIYSTGKETQTAKGSK